ncbi:hypothetical protein AB1Y20_013601 [Prymnesium parvum]|uniref:Acyltransferase 3 domain-containing protein n=1 Tax=Prymnesium parvum TaxID=97485 RepID=A0AB34IHX5_PRYPA
MEAEEENGEEVLAAGLSESQPKSQRKGGAATASKPKKSAHKSKRAHLGGYAAQVDADGLEFVEAPADSAGWTSSGNVDALAASGESAVAWARKGSSTQYRPDIDGLRAVAVIAVMIYHLDHSLLPGGFVGVDIFFVISGFVVSGSLLHKQHPSTSGYFAAFYSRRIKRLTPALATCIIITTLGVVILIDPAVGVDEYLATAQLAVVGLANNHFAARGNSYFDEAAGMLEFHPFLHTWSLGVEEQFYFLFPLLICLPSSAAEYLSLS